MNVATKVFMIPAAEGYKSVTKSEFPAELGAEIYGLLSLDISQYFDDRQGQAQGLVGLGLSYFRQRRFSSASAYLTDALQIFRTLDDLSGQGRTLLSLGAVSAAEGTFHRADVY